ncbi:MAG: hypothetical protein AB1814_09815 [Thermodesulfobacteriota bacterium]
MPRLRVYHPLLLACFPVLFYFSQNVAYLSLGQLPLPLGLALGGALLLTLLVGLVFRQRPKAYLILSLGIVLFFALGPALEGVKALWGEDAVGGLDSAQLLRWWLAAFIAGGLPLALLRRDLTPVNRFLNLVSAILVLLQLGSIAFQELAAPSLAPPVASKTAPRPVAADQARLPHIYYIVLDGMGRADILHDIYGLDGQKFSKALEQRGFYVASRARANYAQTNLALSSSLNYAYLDPVLALKGPESAQRALLVKMLKHNRLFAQLKAHGYRIVAFPSGCPETELRQADQYFSGISEFHDLIIRNSLLEPLLDLLGMHAAQADRLRRRILWVLDHLPDPAADKKPVFVFAHLLSPHPPFLLGPHGEPRVVGGLVGWADGSSRVAGQERLRREYLRGYRDQVLYLRGRILQVIDRILAASPRPVAILLQGDHGPGSTLDWDHIERSFLPERMTILSAFRLPGPGGPALYPTISPVNSFRVVLDRYLGAELPLLPDESYISALNTPFKLFKVTDRLNDDYASFRPLVPYAASGLDRPGRPGAAWNAPGNLRLLGFGAEIVFDRPQPGPWLELSLDGDDAYRLIFLNQGRELAALNLPAGKKTALALHRLRIPPAAAGFTRLRIIPSQGDQRYALGHLRLPAR